MSREVALIDEGILVISPCSLSEKRKKKLTLRKGQPEEESERTAVFDGVSGDSAYCLEAFTAKRTFTPLDKKVVAELSKFSKRSTDISATDWKTLEPGVSVADEVVRVYFELLQKRALSQKIPIVYLGPDFMIKIERDGLEERWISRYFNHERFQGCDFLDGAVVAAVLIPAAADRLGHFYTIEIKFKDLKVRGYESFYSWDDSRNQAVQKLGEALSLAAAQLNVPQNVKRSSFD